MSSTGQQLVIYSWFGLLLSVLDFESQVTVGEDRNYGTEYVCFWDSEGFHSGISALIANFFNGGSLAEFVFLDFEIHYLRDLMTSTKLETSNCRWKKTKIPTN